MKKLTMTFIDEKGKKAHLKPNVAREDLSGEEVKSVMDGIAELNIFERQGNKLYVEPASTKYTETITTELF